MPATITHFRVSNGDMTLIKLENGKTILIDINIRAKADDPDDPTPDIAAQLREQLKKDEKGRYYVDVFLLSHPDQDHCAGLRNHFHLGPPAACTKADDKILIREMWSSPMIFRRASSKHPLCEDAKAFKKEAKRRVTRFEESGKSVEDGDRLLILGRDEKGKTDGLEEILIEIDQIIDSVNGEYEPSLSGRLLGPLPISDDEDEEETLSKNRSSVVLRFDIKADGGHAKYLTGGDAEVAIWEKLWNRHKNHPDWLEYDLLLSPHHCSWHTLSHDSWSEKKEDAQVSQQARNALSQTLDGAHVIASSNSIKDDDIDPPCIRAKREYQSILDPVSGKFLCTGDDPNQTAVEPIVFEITKWGLKLKTSKVSAAVITTGGAIGREPLPHG